MIAKNIARTREEINQDFQKRFRLIKQDVKNITNHNVDSAINLATNVL